MNKLSENIVRKLLDDDDFVNKCKNELNEIMKDKKFDSSDLPEVMSLIVLVTEKYDTFDIDKNNIVEVFRLLIIELLKKINLIEETNSEIDKMLESCLKLLVLKVKTNTFWQKIYKCCKPTKETKKIEKPEEKSKILNKLQDDGEFEIIIEDVPLISPVISEEKSTEEKSTEDVPLISPVISEGKSTEDVPLISPVISEEKSTEDVPLISEEKSP
jgi:hypothetical protein